VGKYALGLTLLGYVIAHNWQSSDRGLGLADALRKPLHYGPLALTTLCVAVSATTTFVRWFVLVHAQELPFTLRDAVRLGMIAYFFNTVLPSAIGGDLVKAVGLARKTGRPTASVSTIIVDRLVGLWGLIWLVSILGAVYYLAGNELLRQNRDLFAVVWIAWIILGISVPVWLVIGLLPDARAQRFAGRLARVPKLGGTLAEAWRAVWMYRTKPMAIAAALGLSFVSQTLYVLSFHNAVQVFSDAATARALPTLIEHSLVVPPGMIAQAIFPAPGGVGGGEFAFGKLYVLLGRDESLGVLGSLALRMTTWIVGFAGYMIGTQIRPSPTEQT
jgi:uncharacterized membrane protein YbhN (UPF0104 family)